MTDVIELDKAGGVVLGLEAYLRGKTVYLNYWGKPPRRWSPYRENRDRASGDRSSTIKTSLLRALPTQASLVPGIFTIRKMMNAPITSSPAIT